MSVLNTSTPALGLPGWLLVVAVGGIGWNLFGAYQFASSVSATPDSLMAAGLAREQAMMMTSYPMWMTLAFGLGVAGGLVGSVLLLVRHQLAGAVLLMSLGAYVALWIGDAVHGVFAAMGVPQVVVLSIVVLIAAGLYVASRHPAAILRA